MQEDLLVHIKLWNQRGFVIKGSVFSLKSESLLTQCDQIGRFLKVLGDK